MSSGLYPVDNDWQPVRGSHLVYFGGWDGSTWPRDRGLLYEPGTVWDYENFDILLGLLTLRVGIGNDEEFLAFPHTELFRRIGMRSTVPGVDRSGNYIMSSQVYTNARDLGRLALLLLDRGRWGDDQLVPESWVDYMRTPAPATAATGRQYGGGWWLPPDDRTDVPQDAFASSGSQGLQGAVVQRLDRALDDKQGIAQIGSPDLVLAGEQGVLEHTDDGLRNPLEMVGFAHPANMRQQDALQRIVLGIGLMGRIDKDLDDALQARPSGLGEVPGKAREHLLAVTLDQIGDQRILVREILVQRTDADPGQACDLGGTGRLETILGKQNRGRIEDRLEGHHRAILPGLAPRLGFLAGLIKDHGYAPPFHGRSG
jgi:hypothetical protein